MKNILKRSLTAALAAVILASGAVAAPTVGAVTTSCTVYSGSNVQAQNYSTWSSTVESYLLSDGNDGLMRVQYVVDDGLVVEYYDSGYNLQSTKIVQPELPLFGGFCETDYGYFVVTGQNNSSESDGTTVYCVTKYDKDWNRLGSCGLNGANTTSPFDAGSLRMDTCGKYLLIHTCHEMYKSDDGYNHQANVTIEVDMDSMEVTDSFTGVMNTNVGYVSHSFNQFVRVEGSKLITLDHGDAYPRAFVICEYPDDIGTGHFSPDYFNGCTVTNVMKFAGAQGTNATGASVGGFELSGSSYLVAGNSVEQNDSFSSNKTRNVFLAAVDKSTREVTVNWLTDYAEGDGTTSTPQLVKLSDDSFVVLWWRGGVVYYAEADGFGRLTSEIYEHEGELSDCVPAAVNGKLIWYTWDDQNITFYDISLDDLAQFGTTEIENGHRYENRGVADGVATLFCPNCGTESHVAVVTGFTMFWNDNGGGSYSSYIGKDRQVGDVIHYWIYNKQVDTSGEYNDEMEVISSDPDVISVDAAGERLNVLSGGTATITFRPKYNPDVSRSYTFTVEGGEDERLMGDVNGDGSVDTFDALMISQSDAGDAVLDDIQKLVADVNGDGSADTFDALLIARFDVGDHAGFGTFEAVG